MLTAAPGRLTRKVRRLSPRAAVLTGGALMVTGQAFFAVMQLAEAGLPALDAWALLVVPVVLTGIAVLWLGPVVLSVAAGQPGWIGAIALPGRYVVWLLGALGTDALTDGAVLTAWRALCRCSASPVRSPSSAVGGCSASLAAYPSSRRSPELSAPWCQARPASYSSVWWRRSASLPGSPPVHPEHPTHRKPQFDPLPTQLTAGTRSTRPPSLSARKP